MEDSAARERPLDIIIFGATGDTGSAACRFLFHHSKKIGEKLRWAPAARNLKKLQKNVLGPLCEVDAQASHVAPACAPIQADVGDFDSLKRMCSMSRAVIACAGPYETYGEPILAACIAERTHYIDVTGEVPWVNRMKCKYGNAAEEAGVCVVSFAGYDSVPMDITAWLLRHALERQGATASRIETFVESRSNAPGSIPTGTIKTVMNMVSRVRNRLLSVLSLGLLGGKSPRKSDSRTDFGLSTGGSPLLSIGVKARANRDKLKNLLPMKSSAYGTWSLPHFMWTINTPIVHLSNEDSDFAYRERMHSDGWMTQLFPVLFIYVISLMVPILALVTPSFLADKLTKKLNSATSSEDSLNKIQQLMNSGEETGLTRVFGFASADSRGLAARSTLQSKYEAGIGFTMQSACAVAGMILSTPQELRNIGFQTPVCSCGGEALRASLEKAGIDLQVRVLSKL